MTSSKIPQIFMVRNIVSDSWIWLQTFKEAKFKFPEQKDDNNEHNKILRLTNIWLPLISIILMDIHRESWVRPPTLEESNLPEEKDDEHQKQEPRNDGDYHQPQRHWRRLFKEVCIGDGYRTGPVIPCVLPRLHVLW